MVLEVNYFNEKAKVTLSEKESEYFYFSDLSSLNTNKKKEQKKNETFDSVE